MLEGHCTQVLPVGACELMLTWRNERNAAMVEMGMAVPSPSFPPFFFAYPLCIILARLTNYDFLQNKPENPPTLVGLSISCTCT